MQTLAQLREDPATAAGVRLIEEGAQKLSRLQVRVASGCRDYQVNGYLKHAHTHAFLKYPLLSIKLSY